MNIGVLAVQGDFAAHIAAFPGAEEVRTAQQVCALDVLVLPGGESSTMLKLLAGSGIEQGVRQLVARGGTLFATCAGAILVAKAVRNPVQPSWDLLDIDVERNAFGRQTESFEAPLDPPYEGTGIFIRAPRIRRVGTGVEVLARLRGEPVFVREGRVFVTTFHPELSCERKVQEAVLAAVRRRACSDSKKG